MTRDQHLAYCKICRNRSFNAQYGIVCGITNQQANFDPTCPDFKAESGATEPLPSESYLNTRSPIDVNTAMASRGSRFVNYLIDTIIVYIMVFVSAIASTFVYAIVSPEAIESMDVESSSFTLLSYLLTFLCMVSYYMIMESVFGRTVGKLITGTRVVTTDGKTPSTYTIFLRSLSRLVPFDAFSFLNSDSRGWHDQWTNTWVVRKNP